MRRRLLASLALLVLPASAGAERLLRGGRAETFWTDNVFGVSDDETSNAEVLDDFAGRIAPWADLADYEGDWTWGVRYAPTYEYYLDQSGLRGFDHDIGGRAGWRLDRETTLQLSERFQRYHALASFNDRGRDDQPTGDLLNTVGERQEFKLNTARAVLERMLGPRDVLSFVVAHNDYDYRDEQFADFQYLTAGLDYDHQLSERASIGTRASWARQTTMPGEPRQSTNPNVPPSEAGPDVDTDYYNLSGAFSFLFSPTFELELSAGPTLIKGDPEPIQPQASYTVVNRVFRETNGNTYFLDADTCPRSQGFSVLGPGCKRIEPPLTQDQVNFVNSPFNVTSVPFLGTIPDVDDTNTTYFADLSLEKRWERSRATFVYTRSASQSTAIASVSDTLYGNFLWQLTERWTASFTSSFERREQASENARLVSVVENQQIGSRQMAHNVSVRALETDDNAHVDILTLDVRLSYQLARNSSLYADANWRDESQEFEAFSRDASRFAFTIGVDYTFEPFNF